MSILHTPTSSISSLAPDSPSPMSANGAQQQLTPITDSESGYDQKPASTTPSAVPTSTSTPAANGTSAAAGAPTQKRKPSRRANTAERRATHNAVERQRRETLNGRFLDLAALLPNLASVRRPSKSAIVNSSIALILSARRQRVVAARELRGVLREAEALRRECNEWRERAGLGRCESPQRSAELGAVLSAGEGVEDYGVPSNGGMPPMPMTPGQVGMQQQALQEQAAAGMLVAGTQGWWEPENMAAMGEDERRAYELVMRATSGEDGGDEDDDDDMGGMYGGGVSAAAAGVAQPKYAPHPAMQRTHSQHGHGQRQSSTGSSFGGFEGASPSAYEHPSQQHVNNGYAMDGPAHGHPGHGAQLDKFGNWTQQTANAQSQSQWAHNLPSQHGGASPTSSGGSPVHGHHVPHGLSLPYATNTRTGAPGGVGLFTPPGTASGGSPLHPSSASSGGEEEGSPNAGARGSGAGTALGLGGLGGGMGFGGMGVDQWGMPLLNGVSGGMNGGGMNGMGGMNGGIAGGRGGMMMAMM